jgi:hypothetical protein
MPETESFESEEESDVIRLCLTEMMQCDGWHFFRKALLARKREQVNRLLSILPNDTSIPLYAGARARYEVFEEILDYKPGDILELIREDIDER